MRQIIVSLLILAFGFTATAQELRMVRKDSLQGAFVESQGDHNATFTFCRRGDTDDDCIARKRGEEGARLNRQEALDFERGLGTKNGTFCHGVYVFTKVGQSSNKNVVDLERSENLPAPPATAPQPSGAKSFVMNLLNGINVNLGGGGYAQDYAQPVYLERETFPRVRTAAYYPPQREEYCRRVQQHIPRWTGGGGSYQPHSSSSGRVVNNNTNTNRLVNNTTVRVQYHSAQQQSQSQRIAASTRASGRPTFAAGDRSSSRSRR